MPSLKLVWTSGREDDETFLRIFTLCEQNFFVKIEFLFSFPEKYDALCILALNVINEKIYVFLWFWLFGLAILTSLYLIYNLAAIFLPTLRKRMLSWNAKVNYDDRQLDILMRKADVGDWFLLFLLSKNLDSTLFKEFIDQLIIDESVQDNPDTQNDLFINDKEAEEAETPAETDDERIESKGFVGAVLKLYYCNFCDTPFQTQAYVIDHLKKYHKIPKNYAKHMKIKKLS